MFQRLKSSKLGEFVNVDTSVMLLRLFAFLMIYHHGFGKVMNVINGNFQFGDPIGLGPEISLTLAAFAEGICALMILVGFWTRLASLILVINMAVAVFFYHLPAGDGFGGIELPLMYLLIFLIIFLLGPGDHSIDKTMQESSA
jgi:putative oxidoreductase